VALVIGRHNWLVDPKGKDMRLPQADQAGRWLLMSGRRWTLGVLAAAALVFGAGTAPAAQTPGPCVPVESQSWWSDAGTPLPFPGNMQHVHAGACFPYKQVLSGSSYTLDVTVKMHNEAGRYLEHVRIDDATDQDSNHRYSVRPRSRCASVDCTFVVPLTVPIASLPTGMHEWRVAASTSPIDSGSSSVPRRNLATSGWQVCIRSCSGRTPQVNGFEGRGWYRLLGRSHHQGYNVVTWGWTSAHDAEFPWDPATGSYRPISGTWTPPINMHLGAHDASMVIGRSRCWVDPDFHNGSAGTPVLNQAGPFRGRLSINTRQFANGLHKLVCAAGSSEDGFLDGVQVFPFRLANP
jgi:hypothetical protein